MSNRLGSQTGSFGSYLNYPINITFDSAGNFYVANYAGRTIAKFNSSGNLMTIFDLWNIASPISLAFQPTTVPEPSTYALCTIAVSVIVFFARHRRVRRA